MNTHVKHLIVGGGLAGLSCATRLAGRGQEFAVVEATDRVGGRVRTDHVDGFHLDHGFQVLLTAYPACRELLDYDALRLRPFDPGALIRQAGKFAVLGDPWRRPSQALATAVNPVGSLSDKLRIAKLRYTSRLGSLDDLYHRTDTTTIDRLRHDGFSDSMIDGFFKPFLGGVYLDESLRVSSRMLEFVFRMFAEGDIAVPADGMAAIPRQLAERLPRGSLRFHSAVTNLTFDGRRYEAALSDESTMTADHVVVAVESSAAAALLGRESVATDWSGTTNLYYAAEESPDARRSLMLRGDESGVVQTAVVLSNVAPEYAPMGRALISVSVDAKDHDPETGDTRTIDAAVRNHLVDWFGDVVRTWRLLRTYRVPYGLPKRVLDPVLRDVAIDELGGRKVPDGTLFCCGDHSETPSIQGAMNSGLRVAAELTD